jgi:hypothetical protein
MRKLRAPFQVGRGRVFYAFGKVLPRQISCTRFLILM